MMSMHHPRDIDDLKAKIVSDFGNITQKKFWKYHTEKVSIMVRNDVYAQRSRDTDDLKAKIVSDFGNITQKIFWKYHTEKVNNMVRNDFYAQRSRDIDDLKAKIVSDFENITQKKFWKYHTEKVSIVVRNDVYAQRSRDIDDFKAKIVPDFGNITQKKFWKYHTEKVNIMVRNDFYAQRSRDIDDFKAKIVSDFGNITQKKMYLMRPPSVRAVAIISGRRFRYRGLAGGGRRPVAGRQHLRQFHCTQEFNETYYNESVAVPKNCLWNTLTPAASLDPLENVYACETWTLTLREEQRLRVFENKVLRKIFGAKRDEVTGEWRKLHNTELHGWYTSSGIIRKIKSRRLRWAGHIARMGESRNAYRVLVGRPEGKRPLGRPRRRWEDNIKMDLREVGYDGRDWINLAQDRDQWRAYVRAEMNLRVP
ncbi:hypothetical protein ANN_05900 [Periplaneta americana]|uniref:Uncharacterized protein n=1 Tax=Periplaneta americana TaxID=6978 RepID=A0ABQ8TDD1_PERAM|nr:hypothetical protein ANN_05900 [Periplaneta americana]